MAEPQIFYRRTPGAPLPVSPPSPVPPAPAAERAKPEVKRSYLTGPAAAALIALTLRLMPLAATGDATRFMDPNGDSQTYLELAAGLRHGCGLARFDQGRCLAPETNRTPGYPLFLAATSGVRQALAAQALIGAIMTLVVGAFATTLWGGGAGFLAAILVALDLPSIVLSNEIMSETLFTALFTFGLLLELRALRSVYRVRHTAALIFLASALFALAILVRPIGEFAVIAPVLIALCPAWLIWRRQIGYALLVIALPVAMIAGWSMRNYRVAGHAAFSTIGGLNLFYYRAGSTLAYVNGTGWESELGKLGPPSQPHLTSRAITIILSHPRAFVRMTAWSLLYVCTVPERAPLSHLLGIQHSFAVEEPGSMRLTAALHQFATAPDKALATIYRNEFNSAPIVLALTAIQLVFTLLTWVGVLAALRFCNLRSYRGLCLTAFILTAAVTLLLAAGPEATARFRVPAIPMLAIAAAAGLSGGGDARKAAPAQPLRLHSQGFA